MSIQEQQRVIVAIDLDAFYVSAARKRDPSLIGLPVGIKQKNIFATVSYEARTLGVGKLDNVKEAIVKHPQLVLVDGEDLSFFRMVSSHVFRLVSSIVQGGKVERLGMDELFCDVTEMVECWEEKENVATPRPSFVGFVLPEETLTILGEHRSKVSSLPAHSRRILRATHIAQHLRRRIAEEVGITCSAGIASSKLVAKLVGTVNKPNHQTSFAPPSKESATMFTRSFLDPYPLRQINGFGSVVVHKLCESIEKRYPRSSSVLTDRDTVGSEQDGSRLDSKLLTVALARQIFQRDNLVELFGERLSDRLWNLIMGIDEEAVFPSPEFPVQISVEDTYRIPLKGDAVRASVMTLCLSLLRRLESELTKEMGSKEDMLKPVYPQLEAYERPIDEFADSGITATVRCYRRRKEDKDEDEDRAVSKHLEWKKFPLSLRVALSQSRPNRVSRQVRMPVEIFETRIPCRKRALVLAQSVLTSIKALLSAEGDGRNSNGIKLINIAAIDLQLMRPSRAIGDWFQDRSKTVNSDIPSSSAFSSSSSLQSPWEREKQSSSAQVGKSIDLSFLQELPIEIQAELAKEYGWDLTLMATDRLRCSACGKGMSAWLQHDHARWPIEGLPPSQKQFDGDNSIDWDVDIGDEGENYV